MTQTRQLAAIMFTDIVGYTALMGNNEHKAFELLRKNREIQKPVIEEFGGRWIKELGDGVMASFPSVSNAVYAAIKIQDACSQAGVFELRIGIHQGEVVFENEDVFGDAVNIASRLQALASPGGIFVSASVHRDLANKKDIHSRFFGVENLKNVKEPIQVYQIYPAGKEPTEGRVTNIDSLSIMPNYEYDIFVSYRDNDNKYDSWVTEFVEKLKQELDATLKDKVSIFFDKNPREGTQDAQPMGQSERTHVKSLIFIPIISQTYCDTSSYAWKQEFVVFKNESAYDTLGRMVKLQNGNLASRILPVRIHDIDVEDVKLLESELSGALRSIDFIYRDAGVNRPLRPVDDEIGTANGKFLYRNQINKVANVVKEIVAGIKKQQAVLDIPTSNVSMTATPVKTSAVGTTVPESIRVAILDQERPNVFLAWTSQDLKEEREEMAIILQKAGFNVYPSTDCPADDSGFKEIVASELSKCSCSLHILSHEFGRRFEQNEDLSFPQFQFEEAKKRSLDAAAIFNTFVWYTPQLDQPAKPAQQEFIKQMRNNITRNMMFSNSPGSMQLVDDMRVVMMKETIKQFDANETDIFFIFNQQDEVSASLITDLISSEYPVEIMNISPDGEEEYREISAQQIPKSKLAVVYFKYAADWALPFIKQVWKQVGGASSPTPMMLIGEDDPESNRARYFKAPKVVSSIVSKDNVSAEVKKVYIQVLKLE